MLGLQERILVSVEDLEERARLLASRGLLVPGNEDVIFGLFMEDRLVATGSLVGNILQGIAVDSALEGEGAAAAVVTALIKKAMERGLRHIFLYSSPEEAERFMDLGFSHLATAHMKRTGLGASLLEWGPENLSKWTKALISETKDGPEGSGIAVLNCNPFTLGHYSLLQRAAELVPRLYALIVEEDRSLFPFDLRLRLVKEGVSDLKNVQVLPGGPYVISAATFPTYFTRIDSPDDERITELYAALDTELFGMRIAPVLKARYRFVGTEPYCPVTSIYNRIMMEQLPRGGEGWAPVEVTELQRLEEQGEPVSASRVRELIRRGDMDGVRPLVPDSTWIWLKSEEARPIIEKIRSSESRH